MKIGDIKNIKIARKYSNALIETAIEDNKTSKVYEDLVFISETIKSNEMLKNALLNPVVTMNDKKEIAERLFSVHVEKVTMDFVLLLIDNNRLDILNEVINQYSASYNKYNNIEKPVVISAVELNDEQKNRIIQKLEYKLSKKVEPEYTIKPDIIGGLVIEIGDKTIDCSLKTKFDTMKKQLTKGNRYGNN